MPKSDDGVNWRKPELELYEYNGAAPNNIVLLGNGGYSDRYGASVLVDPRDPDPQRRYKMAHYDFCIDEGVEYPGLTVAFSPDGIRWTKYPKAPLLRTCYSDFAADVPLPQRARLGMEYSAFDLGRDRRDLRRAARPLCDLPQNVDRPP